MKIYTKTGDNGTTSLLSGRRVPKYHQKIEAYGTVDELLAFTGLLRDGYEDDYYRDVLLWIQDRLMTISSLLSADGEAYENDLPQIQQQDLEKLEFEIDKMEDELPVLKSFILPGGCIPNSYCHIARTVCRRAERIIIKVAEEFEVGELVIHFLNRLSDFYFVLSRLIIKRLGGEEIHWEPKL